MNKEIEEMANFIHGRRDKNGSLKTAEALYNAGYGNVSEYEAERELLGSQIKVLKQRLNNKCIEVYNLNRDYTNSFERLKAQEREIAQQKDENIRLRGKLAQVLLAVDTVKEMNAMCDIDDQRKQAVKEFAGKIKDYINNKVEDEYGDMSDSVNYITIDIDEFETFIDNLLEVQNGENKSRN